MEKAIIFSKFQTKASNVTLIESITEANEATQT
jgi:hypothetical protein